MDDMNRDPFERQVDDVANRAVGPERHVEALAIARHAAEQGRRRRFPSLFGAMKLATAVLIVAMFGIGLLMSGVLDGDPVGDIGASPSASPSEDVEAIERGPTEVLYASGSFKDHAVDWGTIDGLPAEVYVDVLDGPRYFTIAATDPRLVGEAILLPARDEWRHVLTTQDIEQIRPVGSVETGIGLLEIWNEEGSWEGTIGPFVRAEGDWEQAVGDGSTLREPPMFSDRATAVLEGRGAYAGSAAYIGFVDNVLMDPFGPGRFSGFEAVIVNAPPARPDSGQSLQQAREFVEIAREAGALE